MPVERSPTVTRQSNCAKCMAPDNEEMVQCDGCDHWYHYACVNVGPEVQESHVGFSCQKCKDEQIRRNREIAADLESRMGFGAGGGMSDIPESFPTSNIIGSTPIVVTNTNASGPQNPLQKQGNDDIMARMMAEFENKMRQRDECARQERESFRLQLYKLQSQLDTERKRNRSLERSLFQKSMDQTQDQLANLSLNSPIRDNYSCPTKANMNATSTIFTSLNRPIPSVTTYSDLRFNAPFVTQNSTTQSCMQNTSINNV